MSSARVRIVNRSRWVTPSGMAEVCRLPVKTSAVRAQNGKPIERDGDHNPHTHGRAGRHRAFDQHL